MSYRLFVADPGLKTWSGHHAASLEALALACGPERVEFFSHRCPEQTLQAESLRLGVRLTPWFDCSFYEAFDSTGTLVDLNAFINSLARDYLRLFNHLARTDPMGLVLHHTMDWPHLVALGIATARLTGTSLSLRHLVLLMFHPGVDETTGVRNPRRFLNYRVALARLLKQPNVRLFAACREHAAAYGALAPEHGPLPVHPSFLCPRLPVTEQHETQIPSAFLRRPLKGERVVLYAGDAKAEKGFFRLPDVIRMLVPALDECSELIIQYNLNEALVSNDLLAVTATLRAMAAADRRINLLPRFLPDRDLMALIASSSLMIFNYDPQTYAHKSSGILSQACYCGTPVVLIGETWLSREAARLNPRYRVFESLHQLALELQVRGCVEFESNQIDEVYRAVLCRPFDEFLTEQWLAPVSVEPARPWSSREPRGLRPLRQALIVDVAVPDPRKSGGCYAAIQEIRMLHALGFEIALATPGGLASSDRATLPGVAKLCREPLADVLKERGSEFDVIYVTRYFVAKPMLMMARTFAPQAKLVLNVADLHFLRDMRQASVERCEATMRRAEAIRAEELAVFERVDLVLSYTDVEKAVIESHVGDRVPVARCPWVEEVRLETVAYGLRRDVAFLGGYAHAPNVDAVMWFVEQVMPLLRGVLPGVRFRVYGAEVPPELERLACEDVLIEGFVDDVSEVYDSCRIFVAPLRYGAGLKAKVAGALARGTPCVLSPIAAEGICSDSEAAAIAKVPEDWVVAIRDLYADDIRWNAASRAALRDAARRFRFDDGVRCLSKILQMLSPELVL